MFIFSNLYLHIGSMSDNDYSENGEDDELNEDWIPDNDILKDQKLDYKKPMRRYILKG